MTLAISRLTKTFATPDGPLTVLDRVDMTLAAGRALALTGESGAGKSTLLHIIAGLEPADAGEVRLNGAQIHNLPDRAAARVRREQIGLVFQQFNLAPSLTVEGNVRLQARMAGRVDEDWIARLVAGLGLSGLLTRYPEQLSGGQQQRVAIARALAARPALIMADEPTGALDRNSGDAALSAMLDLVKEAGAALLIVTHSERVAARADAVLRLTNGKLT